MSRLKSFFRSPSRRRQRPFGGRIYGVLGAKGLLGFSCSLVCLILVFVLPVKQTVDEVIHKVSAHFVGFGNLKVRHIYVDGRQHTTLEDVQKTLGWRRGTSILGCDLEAARHRLEANLSWIQHATISRYFPDTLYLKIHERKPLALWQHKGQLYLIDQKGTLIKDARLKPFQDLIVFVGGEAPAHAQSFIARLRRFPALHKRITAAIYVSARRWDLMIDNALKVKLPEDNLGEALVNLQKLHDKNLLNPDKILAIDLRLGDRSFFYMLPSHEKKAKKLKKA